MKKYIGILALTLVSTFLFTKPAVSLADTQAPKPNTLGALVTQENQCSPNWRSTPDIQNQMIAIAKKQQQVEAQIASTNDGSGSDQQNKLLQSYLDQYNALLAKYDTCKIVSLT